jgi:uncharacterized membrane protein
MPLLYHPLIVHFPIALWLTSALFDLLSLRSDDRFYARVARFLIGLGLLSALVSIGSGYLDIGRLNPEDLGGLFVARHNIHRIGAFAATIVYAFSFYLRTRTPGPGRGVTIALMLAGTALIAWTGWIGGEVRMVM